MSMFLPSVPVAMIDLETIIIGLVIFGSVVSKIMKARNQDGKTQQGEVGRAGPPPAPAARRDISGAQDELEAFLKSLNSASEPIPVAPAASPPPSPKPVVRIQTPQPVVRIQAPQPVLKRQTQFDRPAPSSPSHPHRSQPVSIKTKPQRLEAPYRQESHISDPMLSYNHAKCLHMAKFTKAVRKDLLDVDSIRKAIVLQEILSAPIALRRGA